MNNELKIVEHKGKRVLTTQQLAEIYETDTNNIKNNFNNHKSNFKEGKHYYLLQGAELKEFKNLVNDIDLVDKRTPQLYLWTERGANRHCKILDTDKAWEQFDNLEETYFRVKESAFDGISKELMAVIAVDKRVTKIEKRVDYLENDIPLYGSEADELSRSVKRKGVSVMDGKSSNAYKDNNLRSEVYGDIYNQIKREFGLYDAHGKPVTYKALKRKYIADAGRLVENYVPPKYLSEKIRDCNSQMNIRI